MTPGIGILEVTRVHSVKMPQCWEHFIVQNVAIGLCVHATTDKHQRSYAEGPVEWPISIERIKQTRDVDYSAAANETTNSAHLIIRQWNLPYHRKMTRISQVSSDGRFDPRSSCCEQLAQSSMSLRLASSHPVKENQVRFPAGSVADFPTWELYRAKPLIGGFPLGSPVFPAFAFRWSPILNSFHSHRISRSNISELFSESGKAIPTNTYNMVITNPTYNPFTVTSHFSAALLKFYFQDIPPPRVGPRWLSDYRARLPPRRTGFNPRPGNRPLASGIRYIPYSPQSSSSALKTSLLREARISSLTHLTNSMQTLRHHTQAKQRTMCVGIAVSVFLHRRGNWSLYALPGRFLTWTVSNDLSRQIAFLHLHSIRKHAILTGCASTETVLEIREHLQIHERIFTLYMLNRECMRFSNDATETRASEESRVNTNVKVEWNKQGESSAYWSLNCVFIGCSPTPGNYGIRKLFPCKSAIGAEASREGLINCDPISKVCWISWNEWEIPVLVLDDEYFFVELAASLVHTMFDAFWRRLAQSLPFIVATDNQCALDIGIFVHKTVKSILQVTEFANSSGDVMLTSTALDVLRESVTLTCHGNVASADDSGEVGRLSRDLAPVAAGAVELEVLQCDQRHVGCTQLQPTSTPLSSHSSQIETLAKLAGWSAVVERLYCSTPTDANVVQSLAGITSGFSQVELAGRCCLNNHVPALYLKNLRFESIYYLPPKTSGIRERIEGLTLDDATPRSHGHHVGYRISCSIIPATCPPYWIPLCY
ncbi:hypothetical protein PR048_019131 [Dryococelus australis]|uniref:Uncharacterized protein n=1 Tax=Dryococelus australis TaxID=614101 RepID=A0ABQ9H2P9_9NEOP|nr:hypothetical protein PR048_019131 [Dryococelus australis]